MYRHVLCSLLRLELYIVVYNAIILYYIESFYVIFYVTLLCSNRMWHIVEENKEIVQLQYINEECVMSF